MDNRIEIQYAGFWDRFAAFVADIVVLVAIVTVFALALEVLRESIGLQPTWSDDTDTLLGLFMGWLYFAGTESSRLQATLGKWGVGIMVTDSEGKRISFAQASWRYVTKLISWVIFFLGFIVAAFTPRKQAFHDYAANTLVIRPPNRGLNRTPAGAEPTKSRESGGDTR